MRQPAYPRLAPPHTPCRNLRPLPKASSLKARTTLKPGSSTRELLPVSAHPGTCNVAAIPRPGSPVPCANYHLQLIPIRCLGVVFALPKQPESQTLHLFVQQGARQTE